MRVAREDLLTADEAIALFGETGLALADEVTRDALALERVLRGGRAPTGLSRTQRALVREHRVRVHHVLRAGFGELLPDQVAGLLSYAGCERVHDAMAV